jgi:hypothetical protein
MVAAALNRNITALSADDRVEKRHQVCLTAVIINDETKPETIQILNIARLGFLAKAAQPRETGDAIIVQIDPLGECEAHIIWSDAGRFGGRFIQPVDISILF